MRILALQLKRIGDLVLTTPALRSMKTAGTHVTLAMTETTAALLPMLADAVDEALIYRAGGGNLGLWRRLLRGGFDASVDFTGRDRSALMTVAAHATVRVIAGSNLRRGGWRRLCYNTIPPAHVRSRHTVDHYLDHLLPLQLPPAPVATETPTPTLRPLPAAVADAAKILAAQGIGPEEAIVVVHPGSARADKYWLPDRWAEVIAFCQEKLGLRCVLTGGRGDPFEDEHLARVRVALAAHGRTCVDLAGRLDLSTFVAVLAQCRLFLGVDSGPAHLAATQGRPMLVLFGPTNPFHWRPRHPGGVVLRAGHGDAPLVTFAERSPGDPLDRISTRAVIDCIEGMLSRVHFPC